ncbi:MAG TPA: HAD-IIB family hydrolase [Candidatus Saccharimonadales bacterium]|nr:HAD-IIB family hydrolase [Candidatus Saccharimonadales bacterium]
MKKLIAFDLDGTLAPSKSTLPERMAGLLNQLLERFEVCIISGGKYELFQRQVLTQITDKPELLAKLHLMPTSGTRYYLFDNVAGDWKEEYAENLTPEQKKKIIQALEEGLVESGHKAEKTYGKVIEDRDSQITLSILGQEIVAELGEEGVRIKDEWDPDSSKKHHIRKIVAPKIPEFEVRAAGATSIDVTKPGIDKAYGMEKLLVMHSWQNEDVLFLGDKIVEGGNDYAVYKMGIDCISVRNWEDTAYAIEGIVKAT